MLAPWEESYDKPRQHIKKQDIVLPTKVCIVISMVLLVVMYGCESSTIKKVEHWIIDAFELWFCESLGLYDIKPVNPKGNQFWIFIGGTDAKAEAPVLWPPDGNNWFIGKDHDAGKDWRQEEKGTAENKMVG